MNCNETDIRKQICDIGKRIYDRKMVAANDGNISVKLSDNEFLCTPTGVSRIGRIGTGGLFLFSYFLMTEMTRCTSAPNIFTCVSYKQGHSPSLTTR